MNKLILQTVLHLFNLF